MAHNNIFFCICRYRQKKNNRLLLPSPKKEKKKTLFKSYLTVYDCNPNMTEVVCKSDLSFRKWLK